MLKVVEIDDIFQGWFLVCAVCQVESFFLLGFFFAPFFRDGARIQLANNLIVKLLDQRWRVGAVVWFGCIPTGELVDN